MIRPEHPGKVRSAHTPGYGPELPEELPEEKQLGTEGIVIYRAIVGSIRYFAQVSRHAICHAADQFSRVCNKPAVIHVAAAKHLPRYLKSLPDPAIIYTRGQFAIYNTRTHRHPFHRNPG